MITRKYILPLFVITSLIVPTVYVSAQGEFILPATQFIIEGAEKIPSVPTSDLLNAAKETRLSFSIFGINIHLPFGMDTIAIAVVKHILERIVDSTTNWINNGFNGNPAYVTDPKQYFADIADGIAGNYIAGSDLNFLCSPFQTQIRLALRKSYQLPPLQCTLTRVVGNIDAFYNDFSQGGWDGWFAMTQNSSNNPYGAYLDAQIELDSRIAEKLGLEKEQLDWGRGFLSWSECEVVNPPMWIDSVGPEEPGTLPSRKLDPRHVPGRAEGECIKQGPIKTPGVVIESQLENVLGTGVRQLELADEFDELIGALLGQLLEKSVFSAKGLFSAPKVASGSSGGGTGGGSGGGTGSESGVGGTLDIDGDGIPDGTDTNGDGVLDTCYFGGTNDLTGQTSCTGSFGLVPTTPPFTTPPSPTLTTPTPTPTPPPGGQPTSLLSDLGDERLKYGNPMTDQEKGQIVNAVAWKNRTNGWGLSRKNFGTFCTTSGVQHACDILVHQPTNTWVDAATDTGVMWSVITPNPDPNRAWIAPAQP